MATLVAANLMTQTATAKRYQYTLTDLTAETTYSVQIAAENSFGRGELSDTLEVTTTASAATGSSGKCCVVNVATTETHRVQNSQCML